jgi:hypothetical protein
MALFWLVHEVDGERRFFIQEASILIDGEFVEAGPTRRWAASDRRVRPRGRPRPAARHHI